MRDKAWDLKCMLTKLLKNFPLIGKDFLNKKPRRPIKIKQNHTPSCWRLFFIHIDPKEVRRARILILFPYKVSSCLWFSNLKKKPQTSQTTHTHKTHPKRKVNNNPTQTALLSYWHFSNCWKSTVILLAS